jgi:hypothetical protein
MQHGEGTSSLRDGPIKINEIRRSDAMRAY